MRPSACVQPDCDRGSGKVAINRRSLKFFFFPPILPLPTPIPSADCTETISELDAGKARVVVDKGCIDALMNGYDQAEWWHERKGTYEGCEHDRVASLQRGKGEWRGLSP